VIYFYGHIYSYEYRLIDFPRPESEKIIGIIPVDVEDQSIISYTSDMIYSYKKEEAK
jgi:hypothetical protein